MSKDNLGDRMKGLEGRYSLRTMPGLPIIVRLDGKAFHTFTKGLPRPYDTRLSGLMVDTTKYLVEKTHATIGYTQSDEITLIWGGTADPFFNGKIQKMCSVLASVCTGYFNKHIGVIPERADAIAVFDARAFDVPTETEAVNCLIWRELDATKNSISMAAQSMYSHKELMGKNGSQKQDMMHAKGVNWNDYPNFFKRGTYVRRRAIAGKQVLTAEELALLPEKHHARTNPDLEVIRLSTVAEDLPPMLRITNRNDVVFRGAAPVTLEKEAV